MRQMSVCRADTAGTHTHTHTHLLFWPPFHPFPLHLPPPEVLITPLQTLRGVMLLCVFYVHMCVLKVRPRSLRVTQASQGLPFLTAAPSNQSPLLTIHYISLGQSQLTNPASKKPIVLINLFRDPSPLPLLQEWVFFSTASYPSSPRFFIAFV